MRKLIFVVGGLVLIGVIGNLANRGDSSASRDAQTKTPTKEKKWYQVKETCVPAIGDQSIKTAMANSPDCFTRHPTANLNLLVVDCSKPGIGSYLFAPSLEECQETLQFLKRNRSADQ